MSGALCRFCLAAPGRHSAARLCELRRPVDALSDQFIHGDLNRENILIAYGESPAFLDMSPFWGPLELALAILANFVGPRRGDAAALRSFAGIPYFDQMLIRAGIRMLIVMSKIGNLEGCTLKWVSM